MSLNDPLSNAMSKIFNLEKVSKKECVINPASNMIKEVLKILNEEGYVGTYEEIQDGKGNHLKLSLLGNINKCGTIKPRFSAALTDYEKYEKRYLPAKDFGIIIVSTSKGLMTHTKAKEKKLGGKLVVYCY